MSNIDNNESDFLIIDETAIPEGKGGSGPLEEGAYNATCVAMVSGIGTKYQSTETEKKVRFVFAVEEDGDTKFLRTNWMKISLWAGDPTPSAMWLVLKAWTKQPDPETLIAKMGKFDLKFFIGKPIQLALTISADGKWNEISSYMAPRKKQAVIETIEIPEIFTKGDKRVTDEIKSIMIDGATIRLPKPKDGDAAPATPAKEVIKTTEKQAVEANAENEDDSDDLPF